MNQIKENIFQTSNKTDTTLFNNYMSWLKSKEVDSNNVSSNILAKSINDAYTNLLGGFGYNSDSPTMQGADFIDSKELSWNFTRINQIYRTQPLVSKISTTWANEMTKSGIDLRGEISEDRIQFIEEAIKMYNNSLSQSANWGFIFGLSACIIYLDGEFNEENLSIPLDMELITKDSFKGLKSVIRWQGLMPITSEYVSKVDKKEGILTADELGEPLYYEVWFLNNSKKYKVHRSRLIIFNGIELPGIEKQIEMSCGVSLVERIWIPLLNYLATIYYVTNMLQISQQRVLKLSEADRVSLMSEEGQAQFEQKMNQISQNAKARNMLVLNEDDEFDYKSANFSNLDRIIQASQEDLAAAANMPMTKLFGKMPTGLNNSSKDNTDDFYDYILRLKNLQLRPAYAKLIPIIYKSNYGEDIPEFSFNFKSQYIPTEEEKALIIDRKTRPLQKAWESNAITLGQLLKEFKSIGKISDCFVNIKDIDISEIDKNGLTNCRYCDFQKGFIVNNQFMADLKTLKENFKGNKNKELSKKSDNYGVFDNKK